MAPKKFTLNVPQERIDKLKRKLDDAELPDEVDGVEWEYGVPLGKMKQLVEHWKTKYDWRREEAEINKLPQFTETVNMDGEELELHFIHGQSQRPDALPLLFVHGWPGHFLEVRKILPLLTNPSDNSKPAFHVIAPSLVNFGFSQSTKKKGFSPRKHGEALHKLMLKLGYNTYATQGGDWGSIITRFIAQDYPQHCKATHLNFVIPKIPRISAPWTIVSYLITPLSKAQKDGIKRTEWYRDNASAYRAIQEQCPQTLGYSLNDSPVGLLAWIYDKLVLWTDNYPWTNDEILDWVSIYYFSRAGAAASVRIYKTFNEMPGGYMQPPPWTPNVLIGASSFPQDLLVLPLGWASSLGPVAFAREHPDGGHFAAIERPEVLANDLFDMFEKGGRVWNALTL